MEQHIKHLANPNDKLLTACGARWQGWQTPTNPAPLVKIDKPMNPPRPGADSVINCEACIAAGGIELEYYG